MDRVQELRQLKENYRTLAREVFAQGLKELFVQFPWLRCIRWVHGTPGYCDGDPCSFRFPDADNIAFDFDPVEGLDVNEDIRQEEVRTIEQQETKVYPQRVYNAQTKDYEYFDKEYVYTTYTCAPEHQFIYDAYEVVAQYLDAFDEDVLTDLYGDNGGTKVSIYRDGRSEVEEYCLGC